MAEGLWYRARVEFSDRDAVGPWRPRRVVAADWLAIEAVEGEEGHSWYEDWYDPIAGSGLVLAPGEVPALGSAE